MQVKTLIKEKIRKYLQRKNRVNKIAKSNLILPRLVVNKSNKYNYAQIIDHNGKVLVCVHDLKTKTGTKKESAYKVGVQLGEKAVENGIKKVCFDRNGFIFHGRIKEIAQGARSIGLQF